MWAKHSRCLPSALALLYHSFIALALLVEPNRVLGRAGTTVAPPPASPAPASVAQATGSNQIQAQQQHPNDQRASINKQTEPPRRQQEIADDEYLIGVGIADITGPAADINLVSAIRQLADSLPQLLSTSSSSFFASSPASSSTNSFQELVRLSYPSWRELRDVKMQLKINFNPLLLRTPLMSALLRWAMPNQIKMQAEYTYANLVVQL